MNKMKLYKENNSPIKFFNEEITFERELTEDKKSDIERRKWLEFIDKTYGCLKDDPIERGKQEIVIT